MKGWECPKCGKVWAPWISECVSCNETQNRTWFAPYYHEWPQQPVYPYHPGYEITCTSRLSDGY